MFAEIIASALTMSSVIPAVGFDRISKTTCHLGILPDYCRGLVKDGIGTHLRGQQFLPNVVRAHGCEGECPGIEEETGGGHDFFARSENDFVRGGGGFG